MQSLKSTLVAAAVALPLAVSAGRAQAPVASSVPFEGRVTVNVGAEQTPMTYSVRQGVMRVDVAGWQGASAAFIVDAPAKRLLVVVPEEKLYMERPFAPDSVTAIRRARPTVVKTGRTEQVAGYTCEHWILKYGQGKQADACMAQGVAAFAALSDAGSPGAEWLESLSSGGWFPLQVTTNGAATPVFTVTKIERASLDPALFTVPTDYRRTDLSAAVGGRGAGR